ncbi:MAG: hypothetical protein BGO41_05410 [Clostridiales bacterium 38-18]|nr:MAG: hypothetical protein BGO41_05410 [Clostridiales bacterium 38-18]
MKKNLKPMVMILMALVLVISQVSVVTYADNNGRGNSFKTDTDKSQIKEKDKFEYRNQITEETKAELRERLKLMVSLGDGNWLGLPDGLAKKGYLNYGLSKRYSKGNFPYGLAKRIKDFRYGDYNSEQSLETLKALISSAKTKLSSENTKVYLAGSKEKLQLAVTSAEAFVTSYNSSKSYSIKTEYNKLLSAIKLFDNSEIVSGAYLDNLKVLYNDLLIYKANYYSKLTSVKQVALDNLIAEINNYIKVSSPSVLTLGIYNDLLVKAEAYKDQLDQLKGLIDSAETLLYVNPEVTPLVFKQVEGILPGNYLTGSNLTLQAAITASKAFVSSYSNQTVATIENEYYKLWSAMEVFKNNIVLGQDDLTTLASVKIELQAYYETYYVEGTNPLTALVALINDIQTYLDKTNPLTQAKLNYFLDASKVYIKDLYDAVKLELQAQINMSNTLLTDVNYINTGVTRTDLQAKVTAATLYLNGTTHKYNELKTYISELDSLNTAFITAGVQALINQANTLLADGKTYGDTERTALALKVTTVQAYLSGGSVQVAQLKTYVVELNTAIKAFVDSEVVQP